MKDDPGGIPNAGDKHVPVLLSNIQTLELIRISLKQ